MILEIKSDFFDKKPEVKEMIPNMKKEEVKQVFGDSARVFKDTEYCNHFNLQTADYATRYYIFVLKNKH